MSETEHPHPLADAIKPLLDAVGARALSPDQARPDDVLLDWEGAPAVAVRLPGWRARWTGCSPTSGGSSAAAS